MEMEAVSFFEIPVTDYQPTLRRITVHFSFYLQRYANLLQMGFI
jgi:hypothetical protein